MEVGCIIYIQDWFKAFSASWTMFSFSISAAWYILSLTARFSLLQCSGSPKKARSMAEARLSRLRGCCLNKPLQAGPCQWHASRAVEWKYTHSGGFQQTGQPNAASSRGRINFAFQRIRQDAPKVGAHCCNFSRGHALKENYLEKI